MNVVVCIKHILDPEIPPSSFEIDSNGLEANIAERTQLMDPYSANALEMALQLKDKHPGVTVTAVTIGEEKAQDSLRKSLGVLADTAVHVQHDAGTTPNAYETAKILAAAIKNMDQHDLVMCGRQAGDWDAGLVGSLLAEELSLPAICFISTMEMTGTTLKVRRNVETGTEVLDIQLPALLTVTNDESNVLRIGKVKDVMKAHRKPIQKINSTDLTDVGMPTQAYDMLETLYVPTDDNICEIVDGDDPADKVTTLLNKLRENKLL